METYFQVARIPEKEKVSITSMYLIRGAKLWWCTYLSDDARANRDKIETWDVLKKELKDQLPCNTSCKRVPLKVEAFRHCQGLCEGVQDCPKRGKLNTLVAEVDDEGRSSWVNPLQLLGAIQEKPPKQRVKPIQGVVCVDLKVGSWIGKCNLMVVPLDDFDVILGMDFMLLAHAMNSVRLAEKNDTLMSALQVKTGLKHGKQTYLAALIEMKSDVVQEVLDEVAEACCRMCPMKFAELRKQLDGLLEAGLIQPSNAPFGSPILFQRKQDGSMRMCMNYRALNKVTIKNKYHIPNAIDLFDKLTKANYYTKIDLRSGYWQVRVARGDEPKTTCVTRYRFFEFLVMLFGLTNAPATFCNFMNDVLYEFLNWFVAVYLDDIVVYSELLINYLRFLRAVFQTLREYELYAKKEKCEFCCEQIMFLEHVISQENIHMDSRKAKSVDDWAIPSKVAEAGYLYTVGAFRLLMACFNNLNASLQATVHSHF
ncbi:RNA-directed DNA polymerase [Sesamum angolense]|uniref:RNA-directed DNA polymerase n=1 Tax=Sesamum angolense TaxID=2727404 RepID=A0AAE1WQJ0_9LAMI|nr:RNA-directed DNA polymerase [Sesamum angolense]